MGGYDRLRRVLKKTLHVLRISCFCVILSRGLVQGKKVKVKSEKMLFRVILSGTFYKRRREREAKNLLSRTYISLGVCKDDLNPVGN